MEIKRNFKKFIDNLKPEDQIALMYHNDADGITSGIIIFKGIKRYKNITIKHLVPPDIDYDIKERTINQLKEKKINKLIITDMGLDQEKKSLEKISQFAEILLIDHHPITNRKINNKITIIKSQDLTDKYYPCAKLTYDLFKDLVDINDLDWIACVGIIGDKGYEPWKDFVNKTLKKYNEKIPKNIISSKFSRITNYINSTKCCKPKQLNQLFKKICSAKNIQELLDSDLKENSKTFSKEMNHWLQKKDQIEKITSDLYYWHIKPKYKINSAITTLLSIKYFSDKTIVVTAEYPDSKKIHISFRRDDQKLNVAELIQKMHKKYGYIKGGGHSMASGATIDKDKLKRFKDDLKETYLELKNQTPHN